MKLARIHHDARRIKEEKEKRIKERRRLRGKEKKKKNVFTVPYT